MNFSPLIINSLCVRDDPTSTAPSCMDHFQRPWPLTSVDWGQCLFPFHGHHLLIPGEERPLCSRPLFGPWSDPATLPKIFILLLYSKFPHRLMRGDNIAPPVGFGRLPAKGEPLVAVP